MKLSCPESARPGLPVPQLRYGPRQRKSQLASRHVRSSPFRKPAVPLQRVEETGAATPSRFALAICPPSPPPRPSRGKSRAATLESPRSNKGIGTGQPLRPIRAAGWASRRLRFPSSSSVSFKFMRSCPRVVLFPVP